MGDWVLLGKEEWCGVRCMCVCVWGGGGCMVWCGVEKRGGGVGGGGVKVDVKAKVGLGE